MVDDVEYREAVGFDQRELDTPGRGEYLIAFDTRLSITVRIFSASPTTIAGCEIPCRT